MSENSERTCIRCIVHGKVQGVFFRASTQDQAQRFGLVGYAKNLPNGCVEVIACGQRGALNNLTKWLHEGPSTARVTSVECETIAEQKFSNFLIL